MLFRSQITCIPFLASASVNTVSCAAVENNGNILDDIGNLFTGAVSMNKIDEEVYLGGYPLGITIDGDGVTIIGLNEFVAIDGNLCCPAMQAGLEINDVIVELDGQSIYGSAKLADIAARSNGKPLVIKFLRSGELMQSKITAKQDFTSKQYRLGLWSKD